MSSSDVKATKALAATGQLQGFIGSGAGTATNLGPIRIQSVQAQASAADGSIKIYDGTSASGTKLLIEFKFGSAANESFDHYLPNDGVKFNTGAYVVLLTATFL